MEEPTWMILRIHRSNDVQIMLIYDFSYWLVSLCRLVPGVSRIAYRDSDVILFGHKAAE